MAQTNKIVLKDFTGGLLGEEIQESLNRKPTIEDFPHETIRDLRVTPTGYSIRTTDGKTHFDVRRARERDQ